MPAVLQWENSLSQSVQAALEKKKIKLYFSGFMNKVTLTPVKGKLYFNLFSSYIMYKHMLKY